MSRELGCAEARDILRLATHELNDDQRAHLEHCARCREAHEANRSLTELGRELEWDEPDPERVEQLRTRLLARVPQTAAPAPARSSRRGAFMLAAALAASVALWFFWRAGTPALHAVHVTLHPGTGAVFEDSGAHADRVVHLKDGSLLTVVEKLEPGQRMRVVTEDAEVEVRGTSFDVTAEHDRLTRVWVLHGIVEVRVRGRAPIRLGQGERWSLEAETAANAGVAATASVAAKNADAPALASPGPAGVSSGAAGAARTSAGASPPATAIAATPAPHASEATGPAAPANSDDPAEAAFRKGWSALKAGDSAAAARAFAAAGSDKGSSVQEDASFWQAVALSRSEQKSAAIAAFRKFLTDYPSSPRRGEASALLGQLLLQSGETAAARERFLDAQKDPRPEVKRAGEVGAAESQSTKR
ncbi:MAG: tetratricopeptide repeat protein [Polyangiaceae bacterium]